MKASEKTLELNVSENLLQLYRQSYPRAFLHGFTLQHEQLNGLDVSISIPSVKIGFGMQFKRPTSVKNNIYKFSINNNREHNQHVILYSWSELFGILNQPPMYYAFPTIFDTSEVNAVTPNFIDQTYFIDPLDMPSNILDNSIHYVEINTRCNEIHVHSKSSREITKFIKGKDIISHINRAENSITVSDFNSQIKEKQTGNYENISDYPKQDLEKTMKVLTKNHTVNMHGVVLPSDLDQKTKSNA